MVGLISALVAEDCLEKLACLGEYFIKAREMAHRGQARTLRAHTF